jgi:predicted PurR-regulated permease PerM
MAVERQVLFWLAAALLLVLGVMLLKDVLLPFVAGLVIAYALNPIAERLAALGLPRIAASGVVVAVLVLLIVVALVFLVPLLLSQVQQLALAIPGEAQRLRGVLEAWAQERLGAQFPAFRSGLDRAAAELSSNWAGLATLAARSVWAQGLALINFASLLLITPLVVFYFLVDWHPMLRKADAWLPRDYEPTVRRLATDIDQAIAAFIRGQGLVCLILGLYYAAGLTTIGLEYGLLIGLATGLFSFVPFVGWAVGFILAMSLGIVQFWPDSLSLFLIAAVFLGGQALDAAVLSPRIVGPRIGLHPVSLIFALAVFSYLFGFVGLLVAVPVAAATAVIVRFALEVYLGSTIYRGRAAVARDLAGP